MQIKTQRDTTVFPLEWLRFKSLSILSVDKDEEELELFRTAGGKVK